MTQQSIQDQLDRIEGQQQGAVQRLDDTRHSVETLQEHSRGQMAQVMLTGDKGLDVSTDPKPTRVPEFMYVGIMAAAMAFILNQSQGGMCIWRAWGTGLVLQQHIHRLATSSPVPELVRTWSGWGRPCPDHSWFYHYERRSTLLWVSCATVILIPFAGVEVFQPQYATSQQACSEVL